MNLALKKGLLASNDKRSKMIEEDSKIIRTNSAEEIPLLSDRELFLTCVALYWGEGYQSERNKKFRLSFTNSNPNMIAMFLRFLREIIKVEDAKIKPYLNLHLNVKREYAVNFWSKVTKLSPKKFVVTIQVSRASSGKRPIHSLPYGTLTLRVHNRQMFMQMKGWIDGLASQAKIES